jgi:hypothetical protein
VFHLTDAGRAIPAEVFFDRDLRGRAVLLHTFGTFPVRAYATLARAAG